MIFILKEFHTLYGVTYGFTRVSYHFVGFTACRLPFWVYGLSPTIFIYFNSHFIDEFDDISIYVSMTNLMMN